VVAGVLRHIEEAGIHSGDSAAVLPPAGAGTVGLGSELVDEIREIARRLALRIGAVGLMNVQFAVHEGRIYVIEANPRASRTVPFIAKAVGVPLAGLAARVMAGATLEELGFTEEPEVPGVFVKAPVFPFRRFPRVDPVLGPEMKSTGEVMGVGASFGEAFAKAWVAAGSRLPTEGTAFLSVHDRDKEALVPVARGLAELGFRLVATEGTAAFLAERGLDVGTVRKVHEGRPNVVDELINRGIALVINTPIGEEGHVDDAYIRQTALAHGVPCITTLSGAGAMVEAIRALAGGSFEVRSLQQLHERTEAHASQEGHTR
jgi:carbamoyl-phosphate synthase large subunit